MDDCCRDLSSGLPNSLLYQILSNLSTKEAALTSVLSKRWRYLFARVPNLDFDDLSSLHPEIRMPDQTSFIAFVNRVLTLRRKYHVNKFSLKCGDGVEKNIVLSWISKVLRRGVSDLALHHFPALDYSLPSMIFVSETLVKLRIETEVGLRIKLKNRNVSLPKLKSLYLGSVMFQEGEIGFAKLLSGCPLLEELVLLNSWWGYLESCSASTTKLKRLTFCGGYHDEIPQSVSFDIPNVVYLEYSDSIAGKYPKVNFDSLVEASIGIRMTDDQNSDAAYISDGDDEAEIVGNAADLLIGICNVKTLYLSDTTLEVLTYCCEAIPVFNNLNHLTIDSNQEIGWESLPDLLKNSPNLETLVFKGLLHKATYRCGDVCLCQGLEISPSCLSSSPVKFLKILKFGETGHAEDVKMEIEQIRHFLENMPNLEQLIICYNNTSINDNLVEVSSQLQMLAKVASSKCNIQVISDNFSLSFTCPFPHGLKPLKEPSWFLNAFRNHVCLL